MADRSAYVGQPVERFAGQTHIGSSDFTGLRRTLRARFGRPTALICVAVLTIALVLQLGDAQWYGRLIFWALILIGGGTLLARLGHPLSAQLGFRFILILSALTMFVVGFAAYSRVGGNYHGEVVVMLGLVVAGLVGLVESPRAALGWDIVAAAAVTAGAWTVPADSGTLIINASAIFVGSLFGNRLGDVLESYFGTRQRLLGEITKVSSEGNAFAIAQGIMQCIPRRTPLRTGSIIWFADDGRSMFIATVGPLPPTVASGQLLPDERNASLRELSQRGPWITGWRPRDDDRGYSRGIAEAGVDAVAYVPIVFSNQVVGLLSIAASNSEGGRSTLTTHFPLLVEVADVAAGVLGPALRALDAEFSRTNRIDELLASQSFWPVFQPVMDLDTKRIVGYEALTRFEGHTNTAQVFSEAAALGRSRELELATIRAAIEASHALPRHCWLSLNASPALLADQIVMHQLLKDVRRSIVIEISEHDAIADYEPIAASMRSLGERRVIAVDDAGAGFASLRHILEVRPAYVKLDLGLVQSVATDITRRALVAGMVRFATDAGFDLIAEGIETNDDLATLRSLGLHYGQGYLLGRPERIEEVTATGRRSRLRAV